MGDARLGPGFSSCQDEGWVGCELTHRQGPCRPHPTRPAARGLCIPFYTSTRINTIVSLVFPCHTRAADAREVNDLSHRNTGALGTQDIAHAGGPEPWV